MDLIGRESTLAVLIKTPASSFWKAATVCYAYLKDIVCEKSNRLDEHRNPSRWFLRGWTLQALISPFKVVFYSKDWLPIGTRISFCEKISSISSIPVGELNHTTPLSSVPVPTRMSWATDRATTRGEDMAYCLLGIFDISMPLLYGEGEKAFRRLQEEISRTTDDHGLYLGNLDHRSIGVDRLYRGVKKRLEL